MGTTRAVNVAVDAAGLVSVVNSIGAHLGAKLGSFHSDERTLTDELCDMFAIWASAHPIWSPSPSIHLSIQKLTTAQERARGADLEIRVATPRGEKRALFQAKVIDPDTLKLRGGTKHDHARLKRQLKDARQEVGVDLTFLLLYVPWRLLDGRTWAFPTWEQGFAGTTLGRLGSFMGASVLPLIDLMEPSGRWRNQPPFQHVGQFAALPHLSLTRILLDLAVCNRGVAATVDEGERFLSETSASTILHLGLDPADGVEWGEVERELRTVLEIPGEFELDL